MGQVVPFTIALNRYPDRSASLDPAEAALLSSVRWWVAAYRRGETPIPLLCELLETIGVHEAAFSVDALMAVVARSVRRPIAIHCPKCPGLSPDEQLLLHAASLVQSGASGLAERSLRADLLSDAGAEFALGPLEGLGELFDGAGLIFSRRASPAGDAATDRLVDSWSRAAPIGLFH